MPEQCKWGKVANSVKRNNVCTHFNIFICVSMLVPTCQLLQRKIENRNIHKNKKHIKIKWYKIKLSMIKLKKGCSQLCWLKWHLELCRASDWQAAAEVTVMAAFAQASDNSYEKLKWNKIILNKNNNNSGHMLALRFSDCN